MRLVFSTDAWGGLPGWHHFEFKTPEGETATVSVTPRGVKIFAPHGLLVNQSLNAAEIQFVSIADASAAWAAASKQPWAGIDTTEAERGLAE